MSQPIFLSISKTFTPQQKPSSPQSKAILGAGIRPRTIGETISATTSPQDRHRVHEECVGGLSSPWANPRRQRLGNAAAQTPPCLPKSISHRLEPDRGGSRLRRAPPLLVLVENGLKLEGLLKPAMTGGSARHHRPVIAHLRVAQILVTGSTLCRNISTNTTAPAISAELRLRSPRRPQSRQLGDCWRTAFGAWRPQPAFGQAR